MLSYEQIDAILAYVKPSTVQHLTNLSRQTVFNLRKGRVKPCYSTAETFSKAFEKQYPVFEWAKNITVHMPLICLAQDMLIDWYCDGEFNRKPSDYPHARFMKEFVGDDLIKIDALWDQSKL
jgi:hypothetical protein